MNKIERAKLCVTVVNDISENLGQREIAKKFAGKSICDFPDGQRKEHLKADIMYARRQLLMLYKEIDKECAWHWVQSCKGGDE